MKRFVAIAIPILVLLAAGFQPGLIEHLQRPRVFVTDYGAVPNDGKDDSAAIKACIVAAMANGLYHVHFPSGTFDIDSNNVLHPVTAGTVSGFGIKFTGDAQNYSILKLKRSAGNTRWLYDSGSAATTIVPGWNRVQFEDLWFQSDLPNNQTSTGWNASYAAEVNGFRIGASTASGGVDKGFIFNRCRNNGFGQPLTFSGTSNTDSYNAFSCWWQNCGPIIFENDQAIVCNWTDCHLWHPQDLFWIKNTTGEGGQGKGGAGNTYLRGSDIINEAFGVSITNIADNGSGLIRVTAASHGYNTNDWVVISGAASATNANNRWQVTRIDANTVDLQGSTFAATGTAGILSEGTTAYYTLRVDDGAGWTRSWVFDGGQWELRQTYKSRLLHKRGNSSFTFSNEVLFDACNLSLNHGAESGATGREYLTLGGYTIVSFRNSALPERLGIGFYDVTSSSVVGAQYQPLVVMDDCLLGPTFVTNLNSRITYDSGSTNTDSYGRVISRGGRALTSTNLNDNYAFDFDYGASRAGRGEPAKERRWIPLKAAHQTWPTSSGGVGASERTATLAPNQKIWAVSIDRPASGSGATLTQYRVGANDKSITYCATGPIRADGHHKAYADATTDPGLFPISVGTDANLRQVRLWLGPVEHTLTTTGGEAMILVE
jgi:hypothetical protein